MDNAYDRLIILIDMDCFFCQVETKLAPELKGKPVAVIQYNQWQLGGIIAVNYEAREFGVTRFMRGDEAKEKCPELILASVPATRGKSNTSRYRVAGREVIDVLKKHCNIIERASVDEAYLDITDMVDQQMSSKSFPPEELMKSLSHTYVVGYSEVGQNNEEQRSKGTEEWINSLTDELENMQSKRLAVAGAITESLRQSIFNQTGYQCSAGVSYNKILAKLACGLHKPNRQTILPLTAVPSLFATLPVKKVRNLGGKFGDAVVESLECNVMADVLRYSLQDLQKRFDEKTGLWLYNIARGIDYEPVITRLVSKSIGVCKKFPAKQALTNLEMLKHWVGELSAEVCDRLEQDLEENERRATLLTVSYQYYKDRTTVSQSRSARLRSYNADNLAKQVVDLITKSVQHPISCLGISTGKFVPARGSGSFKNFFTSNNETFVKKSDYSKTTNSTTDLNSSLDNATNDSCQKNVINANSEEMGKDICNMEKPLFHKNNSIEENVFNVTKSTEDTKTAPKKNLKKAFTSHNCKESFFMNILSDNNDNNPLTSKENLKEQRSDSEIETDGNSTESMKEGIVSELNNDSDKLISIYEIFPDLTNIDHSIVSLLPIELQNEVNEILRKNMQESSTNKISKATGEILATTSNVNTSASNTLKTSISECNGSSTLSNYFIKHTATNDTTKSIDKTCIERSDLSNIVVNNHQDKQLERCKECNQMIPIEGFNEHQDFHIAQILDATLNKHEAIVIAREKVNTKKGKEVKKSGRKRPSEDSKESNAKWRNIEYFLKKPS
ncbi:DNA polymerase eta [Orussus abietinus]|uniref:DNA polymerase eta n=1 Tax=Orussus abietinus TaxID=222816 RepID=UPI000625BCA0|nr:DNA polymerase eta [Orussus abietinus]